MSPFSITSNMHFLNIQNPISGDLPPEEQTALANAENSPIAPQVVGNGGRRRRVLRHRCPFPNCCHVDKECDDGGGPSDDDDRRSEDGEGCTEDNEEEMMESGEVTIVEQFNQTADYRAQANDHSRHHRHYHSSQHIHHHHHHHYHTSSPQLPPSQILPTVSATTPKSTTLVSRGLVLGATPSCSPPPSPCPDTSAPTSHIPQYLREKAKQYILEQLHVSERRHTKKLQLVQTWITSLEDQVYRSATTQDDYITQLAFRLAAILTQLDNSRFSSRSLPRTCDTPTLRHAS